MDRWYNITMEIKQKYLLDEKILEQIEDRVNTPNGNDEYNLLFPLLFSMYGHLIQNSRDIHVIKCNPVVTIGAGIKKMPVLSGFIGMVLLWVIVQLHDPTQFLSIIEWLK